MVTGRRPAEDRLTPAADRAVWTEGTADMDPESFRAAAHEVVDLMADYLRDVERYAVFPSIEPGSIRPQLPSSPPDEPEPIESILDDYRRIVEPNATHWQHPGFFAYFATTASGPGILGEMLTATLGQNPMLWRTSPIGTELEETVVDWLRQALGLPDAFEGFFTDTASISSLIALGGAREAAGFDVAAEGLGGRPDMPRLRVYASAEAHSSIERALMTLGLGRESLAKVSVNHRYEMDVTALERAIAADRAAGVRPIAVVATIGTTSSTSVDPVAAIADVAEREGLWLHVDSAYAGPVALVPDRRTPFAGWERADSVLINPHKWLFTPLDASLLLTRRMPDLRTAFSLVPEYLRTLDRQTPVRDFSEYGPQLGRRMRALKVWMIVRAFGLDGLRRRIDRHCELAAEFASWVDAEPDWERLAPVPFSTVCFRHVPPSMAVADGGDPGPGERIDAHNAAVMDAVNRTGEVFLSHTRLDGQFAIRLAIGNVRTEERHVVRAWELLREAARREASGGAGATATAALDVTHPTGG
ncbi:MAG TPA: pyridoxal-dependent decarboxylase [Candidatus Binatia bacterium]|nr:pyridoxal-dependent decarboxylase [Candidatus Binatia bacterium]